MMAAASLSGSGKKVLLVEKNRVCGRKLLITGKGRCNITNARPWEEFSRHIHPNGAADYLKTAFHTFSNSDTVDFMERLGLPTVVERGDRVFPASGRSSDVRDVLLRHIVQGGIEIMYLCDVISVSRDSSGYRIGIVGTDGAEKMEVEFLFARAVILATGGRSYPLTGSTGEGYALAVSLGHSVTRLFPSLTALVPENYNRKLIGLTLKNVSLALEIDGSVVQTEQGELSFTSGGIEGALGFRVSRNAVRALDAERKVRLLLDLKPGLTVGQIERRIIREYTSELRFPVYVASFMPMHAVGPFMESFPRLDRKTLPECLKNWVFPVKGYVGYDRAVVTAGGIPLKEVSRRTMESKLSPGLFFAGEMLDIDGDTGGYNLQIAFSTGHLAAVSALASTEKAIGR